MENLTIPDRIMAAFVSARSNTGILTITLPLIADTRPCCIVISAPDGAANNVTVAPRGGNTVLGGASLVISADNLVVLIAAAGATNYEGHVGT